MMQIIDFPVQQKAPRQAETTSLLEDELTKALVDRYFDLIAAPDGENGKCSGFYSRQSGRSYRVRTARFRENSPNRLRSDSCGEFKSTLGRRSAVNPLMRLRPGAGGPTSPGVAFQLVNAYAGSGTELSTVSAIFR